MSNRSCQYCKYANKAANPEYVFCLYWQGKANDSSLHHEEFVKNEILATQPINQVGLGWGFPNKAFNDYTPWIHRGTASESLMWADQICIDKDKVCEFFELRKHTKDN